MFTNLAFRLTDWCRKQRRRGGWLLWAVLLLVSSLASAAPAHDRVELRVGWFRQGNHFLLHYVDAGGLHQGLTPDTLRSIVTDKRVTIHYRLFNSFAEAAAALEKGELDLLPDMLATPERQRAFWMSRPYADLPVGVVQPRAAGVRTSVAQLDKLRVAVIGDAWQEYLKQAAPMAVAVRASSPREAVNAVAEGRADAYLGFYFAGAAEIQRTGLGSLVAREVAGANRTLHFLARAGDQATIAMVSDGLDQMSEETRRDIRLRWMDAVQDAQEHALSFTPQEEAWLLAHPVLKVGIPGFTRPYDYLDDEQNWHGPGAELLRRFAVSAGVRLEPVLLSRYEAPHEALQRGVVDVTPSFSLGTAPRGVVETAGYAQEPWGWVRRPSDTSPLRRVAAVEWRLHGVTPGLERGRHELLPVASTAEALAAIVAGRADAAYVNLFVAHDLINQFYSGRLQVSAEQNGVERLSFALPSDRAILRDMLNRAIASYAPGELDRLSHGDRQTVMAIGYDKRRVWWTALVSAAAVGTLLLTLGWINRRISAAGRVAEAARRDANSARQQAEAADRAKSVFLATMSHEIRTPLNGVIGVIDLLQDSALDEQQRRYLNVADQSARLLLRVLNDVLDYSKIEAGALTLEHAPFSIYEVAAHIAVLFRPLAIEQGIGFGVAVMPHFDRQVLGDSVRLTQILANLVGNAIRFTEQGAVIVELRNRLRGGRPHLQLCVSDTGCGMSPEFQRRIFQPFQQELSSSDSGRSGTGLGLSIVKQLTDRMRGSVAVESSVGVGTKVVVEIPLEWGEPLAPWPDLSGHSAHVALAPGPLRRAHLAWLRKMKLTLNAPGVAELLVSDAGAAGWRMEVAGCPGATVFTRADFVREAVRLFGGTVHTPVVAAIPMVAAEGDVLLCEDHAVNREIMMRQLGRLGFDARCAIDGEDGLRQWHEKQPRIVLADCHMPRMDGYTLAREIRAAETRLGLPRTLIIAVSANASQSDGDACIAAGMDDYLAKPMTRQMLVQCLQRWGVELMPQ